MQSTHAPGRGRGRFSLVALAATLLVAVTFAAGPERQAMDGVYTVDQAEGVVATYRTSCGGCHGNELGGSGNAPPLSGIGFTFFWKDRTVGELFEYTRANMPQGAPGTLSDGQYAGIVALILQANGFPAGEQPLPTDPEVLSAIRIGEPAPQ